MLVNRSRCANQRQCGGASGSQIDGSYFQADLYLNLFDYSYFQRKFWVNEARFAPAKLLPLTRKYCCSPAGLGAELPFSTVPATVDRRRIINNKMIWEETMVLVVLLHPPPVWEI